MRKTFFLKTPCSNIFNFVYSFKLGQMRTTSRTNSCSEDGWTKRWISHKKFFFSWTERKVRKKEGRRKGKKRRRERERDGRERGERGRGEREERRERERRRRKEEKRRKKVKKRKIDGEEG